MKYIKKFNNHLNYLNFLSSNNFIKPNVSKCVSELDIHYNKWYETRVVAKYNVTDITQETKILRSTQNVNLIEIDGNILSSLNTSYQFTEIGIHVIKYTLNDNTKFILGQAFNGCTNLIDIYIPETVTNIPSYTFNGTSITSINIPKSITTIETCAFQATALTSVKIPNTVVNIGINIFAGNKSLINVILPNNLTTITTSMFNNCKSLTYINIPDTVIAINMMAFLGDDHLLNITIPANVTYIGSEAFRYCNALQYITCLATTPPTLSGSNIFPGSYPIYVPSEALSLYQNDESWSIYINRLQAII